MINKTPYIIEHYADMTVYELMEVTGRSRQRINDISREFHLKRTPETEKRYAEQRREKLKKVYRRSVSYDRMLLLSGKKKRGNRLVTIMSPKMLNAGKYLRKRYNYFNIPEDYDDGIVDKFYYDKDTRRCRNEERFTKRYGFKFLPADGYEEEL